MNKKMLRRVFCYPLPQPYMRTATAAFKSGADDYTVKISFSLAAKISSIFFMNLSWIF